MREIECVHFMVSACVMCGFCVYMISLFHRGSRERSQGVSTHAPGGLH